MKVIRKTSTLFSSKQAFMECRIIVAPSGLYNHAIKRINQSLGEKDREKSSAQCDEGMKNARNYRGICITAGFQTAVKVVLPGVGEFESISRVLVNRNCTLRVSLRARMAKTFGTIDGGKRTSSQSCLFGQLRRTFMY